MRTKICRQCRHRLPVMKFGLLRTAVDGLQPRCSACRKVLRRDVWVRDNGRCQLCRKAVAFNAMHLDHKIPLSRGGAHSMVNVQTACAACNLSKHSKTMQEYDEAKLAQ